MKKIPENVMIVLKAVAPLIGIVILFMILAKIGFGKISEVRAKITEAKQQQAVLTQKLEMLRVVSLTGVEDANIATSALPDSNASLVVISQLKNLAVSGGLILTGVKAESTSSDTEEINTVSVGFNILGNKDKVIEFLNSIDTFAPISELESVKLNESEGNLSGEISVKSYWSPLPTKLPASIEEFQDLSPEDKETLTNVSNLTQPQFITLPPASPTDRQNPFR